MAQAGKNKQGDAPPSRRNWSAPVGQDSRSLAASAFARKGFADPTLVLRWAEIVGPEVARLARPIRLSQGADGGTLTLKAEPGASVFLQHETPVLCERINAYLGRAAVRRLRFIQGPLQAGPAPTTPGARPGPVAADDRARRFQGGEGLREALLALARRRRVLTD